ncbi:MAG: hypothetical protein NVS4B13_00680 [Candidatus Elarobacter sp.]
MTVPRHPVASIRAAIARSGAGAAVVAAIIFAASAAAHAQTVIAADQPAPAASPAGQPNPSVGSPPAGPNPGMGGQESAPGASPAPRPAKRPVTKPPPPLNHYPVIDFVVTFTQPAYYTNMSQLPAYDPIDLGGTVRIPVTRKINLFFDRITEGTINQPLERSYVGPSPGTTAVFPKASRDVILQYHGTYTFDRFLTMDVGHSFRHRIQSYGTPASGGTLFNNISAQPFPYTLNSQEHHFSYLGLSYTTKPWKEFLHSVFVLSDTLDVQNVDHNVAILCTPAMVAAGSNKCTVAGNVGYLDENPGKSKYYETTQGVTWLVPVDPKHGTTFLMNERWGYLNFYQNAPFPYRWTSALTYQLSKRFSPGFTLAMRHQDLHSSPTQSAPFTAPNSIHVGSWDIIGTFHFETSSLFPK